MNKPTTMNDVIQITSIMITMVVAILIVGWFRQYGLMFVLAVFWVCFKYDNTISIAKHIASCSLRMTALTSTVVWLFTIHM